MVQICVMQHIPCKRTEDHSIEQWVLWQSSHFQDLEAFWRMTRRYLMLIQSFVLELSEKWRVDKVHYWLGWKSFWDSLGFTTWRSCAPKHRLALASQKSGPLAFLHSLPSMEASQKWGFWSQAMPILYHSNLHRFAFSRFQAVVSNFKGMWIDSSLSQCPFQKGQGYVVPWVLWGIHEWGFWGVARIQKLWAKFLVDWQGKFVRDSIGWKWSHTRTPSAKRLPLSFHTNQFFVVLLPLWCNLSNHSCNT